MAEELKGSVPEQNTAEIEAQTVAELAAFLLKDPEQKAEEPVAEAAADEPAQQISDESQSTDEGGDSSDEGVETPESDESETPEETEEPEAQEAPEDQEPKGVQKRIDKLTARAKTAEEALKAAEEKAKELETRLGELEQKKDKPVVASQDGPLASVWSEEDLEAQAREYRKLKRLCEANPDGLVVKGDDGKEVEYTADQVRAMRFKAEDVLDEDIPKRREFLTKAKQADDAALQKFPWWKDRTHPDYQLAQQFLNSFPAIKSHPSWKLALGALVKGARVIEAEDKAKKPAPVVKAPKQPAKPSAAPKPPTAKQVKTSSAESRFSESMSQKDLAEILKERMT